jgi:trk system potassium uptake protein TrkA
MHIIIIGAGEVGRYLAKILAEERHDVYVIEHNEKLAGNLNEQLDARVLHGSGISRKDLQRAGIDRADLLLAVTEVDEVNLVAAMTAEKLNHDCRTVSRVRDTRFLHRDSLTAEEYGINFLLGLEEAVAQQVIRLLQYGGPGQISPLADGQMTLLELPVKPHSTLPYVTCGELASGFPPHSRIVAVLGDDAVRLVSAEDRLQVGEHAYVLAAPGEVNEILSIAVPEVQHVKRVLLIGGGEIGFHVGGALERLRFDVTIIEKDQQRAEDIAVRLRKSVIIHGDGSDPSVISQRMEEGQDAVVVLPKDDATALVTGIVAKHFGGKKVIVRVDDQAYAPIARKLGIDALISPRRAVADAILQFVRRSHTFSTTLLGNHQGELIDFQIDDRSKRKLTEVPVGELDLPKNCTIGAISRGGEIILPRPDDGTHMQAGDHVFVVALRDAVPQLEELFD